MKKKGFTLVELLAVIAILAILVIIALPNVLGMFNQAKKNTFITELQSIYDTASTQFVSDNMKRRQAGAGIAYSRISGAVMNENDTVPASYIRKGKTTPEYAKIDLSGTTSIDFYIEFNIAGNVITYYATDGQFQYIYEGPGLKKEDIEAKTVDADKDCTNNHALNVTMASDKGANTNVVTIADALEYCEKGHFSQISYPSTNSTMTFDTNAGNAKKQN